MVEAQTNGASENPDSTQVNDSDHHADNDDDRVKDELKEFTSYQEPVVQSDVEDCVSPDMPVQVDSILPLAMSPIIANMTSNSSEDVNDGNCLDVNASKYDELHDKKEVDELELAVDHVDDIPIYVNGNGNDGNSYDANTFKDERLNCKEEDEKLEWPVIPVVEDYNEDLDKYIRDRLQQFKIV